MANRGLKKGSMTPIEIKVKTGEVIRGQQQISKFMTCKYHGRQEMEAKLLQLILGGEDIDALANRKGISRDYVQSILNRASSTATVQTSAQLQVALLSRVQGLAADTDRKWLYVQELMREIELSEDKKVKWVDIEKVKGVGRNADGTQTKQIPIAEAKKRLYSEMIQCHQDFLDGIKNFVPKHVVHTDGDLLNEQTSSNIQKEIEELEYLKRQKERAKNENAA